MVFLNLERAKLWQEELMTKQLKIKESMTEKPLFHK